ncbi:hypothetical protein ACO0LF_05605 [Undibacterium sp. Di27W]|uniref:hypothetical protein n=1 Tax=Undibacterium sp. Di27W TaxID=3413036 RepID=UPI003BF16550
MSYVMHIWEGPEPANVKDIPRLLDLISQNRSRQNPKFIEFASKLMQRYPYDDDEEEETGIWTDGFIDGKLGSAVFVLGVATPNRSICRFIVSTAKELGLNVHDMQEGRDYFSSGRVVPPFSSVELSQMASRPEILSITEKKIAVNIALHPFLSNSGFTVSDDKIKLIRRLPDGIQRISPMFIRGEIDDFYCPVKIDEVQRIYNPLFLPEDPDLYRKINTFSTFLSWIVNDKSSIVFPAGTDQEIKHCITRLAPVILKKIIPQLDWCTDVMRINEAIYNNAIPSVKIDPLRRLIIARLADDPCFENLVQQLDAETANKKSEEQDKFFRLRDFLRKYDVKNPVSPEIHQKYPYDPSSMPVGTRIEHIPMKQQGVISKITGQCFGTRIHINFDDGDSGTFTPVVYNMLKRI